MTRSRVDHGDLAAAGYFTPWTLTAGSTADFHLSSADSDARVALVRLDRASRNAVDWPMVRTEAALATQTLALGAFLTVALTEAPPPGSDWRMRLEFRLSAMPHHRVLIAANGFDLRFDADGVLGVAEHRNLIASAPAALPILEWLSLSLRHRCGRCMLEVDRLRDYARLVTLEAAFAPGGLGEVRIGAAFGEDTSTLNAAIGRCSIACDGRTVAEFRIPPVGRPKSIAAVKGNARLTFHNAPTFATRSIRWDGTRGDPGQTPEHYDAVTLHDDDLGDADWPVSHRIAVPAEAESGIYALAVSAAGRTTRWPFFVTPRRRTADLVFLAPTFTYLAYADERLPEDRFPWHGDDPGHRFARANALTSLYDTHNDGSGVSLASFRRPLATIRDDYRYPLCGAPHLLPVDLRLLQFLAAQGIGIDVITDEVLHRDGLACLAGYRGLVTGSHPEYWTGAMLDAVGAFREGGGHIAYLGGNGAYWVTACDGDTIEVRRGERGIRTWSSAPGESRLATTGEPGGLWRDRGRAEHRLFGTGLAAMGFAQARPFHRTQDSYAADVAWLFEGVGDAPIGADGILLGGAAGYEIDCRSAYWGMPETTILLAVADGFDAGYEPDPTAAIAGAPGLRAEMTLSRAQSGARVFAASSVSWCGALPDAGSMNAVGLITRNLLRRFQSAS